MFTVAISAGGQSSRMGRDKSFVEVGGKPIIERVLEVVQQLEPAQTLLITNRPKDYAHLEVPMVGDVLPDKGSLGGIYTALYHSQQPSTLVIACDMPFLHLPLLRYMLGLIPAGYEVIVPRLDKYPQGLHAIYAHSCLPHIKAKLDEDKLKVLGFYPQVQVRYLDEAEYQPLGADEKAFFNVNTPEELAEAQRLASLTP